jgi:hypothetical protein
MLPFGIETFRIFTFLYVQNLFYFRKNSSGGVCDCIGFFFLYTVLLALRVIINIEMILYCCCFIGTLLGEFFFVRVFYSNSLSLGPHVSNFEYCNFSLVSNTFCLELCTLEKSILYL